jgi:CRISPR-associated protein Cas1
MVLKGRLGLETARVPHTDRHGLLWLERGRVAVEGGNLVFTTAGNEKLDAGAYEIPFQQISCLLLGPGTAITHDALRLLARQQTGILAVGSNGIRLYASSMPFGPDRSALARKQALLWSDEDSRIEVVRRMYEERFGEPLPDYARDIASLRGIEGKRMKKMYQMLAQQYGVKWQGRRFDRNNPESDDTINKAINHATTATYAAAQIAVAVTGTIPQLGFIHESSGRAFALDIADLFRSTVSLPIAFRAAKQIQLGRADQIERETRKLAGQTFQDKKVIPEMIDKIKELLTVDDDRDHA